MKTIEDFIGLMNFYKGQAEDGRYHNPHEVEEELSGVLREIKFKDQDEWQKYKDMAHDTGLLFWDM
jgi:hypothetical protein